jgi:hypothetical protein
MDEFGTRSQQADNGLTFLLSGALPKRRHISCQEPDRGDLGRTKGLRLSALEPLMRVFEPGLFSQLSFPLALTRTSDQAVLWLDGMVSEAGCNWGRQSNSRIASTHMHAANKDCGVTITNDRVVGSP